MDKDFLHELHSLLFHITLCFDPHWANDMRKNNPHVPPVPEERKDDCIKSVYAMEDRVSRILKSY